MGEKAKVEKEKKNRKSQYSKTNNKAHDRGRIRK